MRIIGRLEKEGGGIGDLAVGVAQDMDRRRAGAVIPSAQALFQQLFIGRIMAPRDPESLAQMLLVVWFGPVQICRP